MSTVAVLLFLFTFFVLRLLITVFKIFFNRRFSQLGLNIQNGSSRKFIKCVVVAGSGGHTSEVLRLVGALKLQTFRPRHYILARTDRMSQDKIRAFESSAVETKGQGQDDYSITYVARSREVGQSWTSTVLTTLRASLQAFPIVFSIRPDLVLVNGPGTCIPVCAAAFLLTVLGRKVTIVFVESICRVTTMSLTGRILYYFADHLFVQWPELHARYPRTHYIGRIV